MMWHSLPEELLLQLFSYLKHGEIISVSKTCKRWNQVGRDDILWKRLIRRDFKIPESRSRSPICQTWKKEYQRLVDQTPVVCTEILEAHEDEVLYVSFANSGKYFVTCSKDGTFIVWKISSQGRVTLHHKEDMTEYGWKYTWAAKFNQSSNLLMVAGVMNDVDGKIAMFMLSEDGELTLDSIIENNPYDVMGTWCDDNTWISGNLLPRLDFFSADAEIRVHCLQSQSLDNETDDMCQLLRFRYPTNDCSNYFRCLLVSDYRKISRETFPDYGTAQRHNTNIVMTMEQEQIETVFTNALSNQDVVLIFLCNGATTSPHQLGFKRLYSQDLENVPVISQADKIIDMFGHIVGIALDKNGKYLYVNVRNWPQGARPHPDLPPPIATEIEMHVLDLETLTFLNVKYIGHKGFTDSMGAFYIYLDTSDTLVCSGSEDCLAYIWDKKFGCLLGTNRHENVVNSVAFNPVDQQTLVTVGDDHKIKIWMSKQKVRESSCQFITHNT